MTPRERVLTSLSHSEPDKVPFTLSYGVNEYARKQLAQLLNLPVNELEHRLYRLPDIKMLHVPFIGPESRGCIRGEEKFDYWGVIRKSKFNGFDYYDEIYHYPLAGLGDTILLDDYEFPSPDWFDYNALKETILKVKEEDDYAISVANANIFEHSWYMTGLENMLVLMAAEPDLAYALMQKVTDFYMELMERSLIAADGLIDIIATSGDIGQQQGMLVSLPMWEKLIKPHHVRLNKMLHNYNVQIMYHTDGAVMEAIDGLTETGIDILDPLQFDAAGMDPVKLKTAWGSKISFHGGISVQKTLPFGTPEEVRKEVNERISVLGRGGGYILAPSHAVQGGTPPENILAFIEEAGRSLR